MESCDYYIKIDQWKLCQKQCFKVPKEWQECAKKKKNPQIINPNVSRLSEQYRS